LHVQLSGQADAAALLGRIVAGAFPNPRGLDAWRSLLRPHATLLRQLATDLVKEVGLTLGNFDVLAQLAQVGGELRMSELAAQAYSAIRELSALASALHKAAIDCTFG